MTFTDDSVNPGKTLTGIADRLTGHGEGVRPVVAGDPAVPGGLLALVAGELPGYGVQARPAGPGSLAVTMAGGAGSILTVSESASVEWECKVARDAAGAAMILADIAACLLGGRDGDPGPPPGGPEADGGLSLKGRAGRELRRRGLAAALAVYEDPEMLEVAGEVIVTSPAAGDHARVRINDDGVLVWERDYWPDYAVITWEPEYSWDLGPQAGELARVITGTVTPAIRRLSRGHRESGQAS